MRGVQAWGRAVVASALLSATACDEPPAETTPEQQEARLQAGQIAADQSASVMASSAGLARMVAFFRVIDLFGGLGDPAAVNRRLLSGMLDKIERTPCLTAQTDGETYLEVVFDEACESLLLEVDGSVRAEVAVIEQDCDERPCRAARWTLRGVDYAVRVLGHPLQSRYDGPLTVEIPFSGDGTLRWVTGDPEMGEDFRVALPIGTLTLNSDARFTMDANDCIVMDLDAEVRLVDGPPAVQAFVDETVGALYLSAQDVVRCGSRCPESGDVVLAYGDGDVLQWTYNEGETSLQVEVRGPRGRSFVRPLPCAIEADAE